MRLKIKAAALFVLLIAVASPGRAAELPDGFVHLADIAPHVRQDMRYAGSRNFTGVPVPGYGAAECVLAEPAAQALSAIGDALAAQGMGLKVFDCYRPVRAVRHFVAWAQEGRGVDPKHYPRVDRSKLMAQGYIARKSGHSQGYTVDLTLTDAEGNALDMGTEFDLFDPLAHTAAKGISKTAAANRRALFDAMAKGGFENYSREWWHFSLRDRPRKGQII